MVAEVVEALDLVPASDDDAGETERFDVAVSVHGLFPGDGHQNVVHRGRWRIVSDSDVGVERGSADVCEQVRHSRFFADGRRGLSGREVHRSEVDHLVFDEHKGGVFVWEVEGALVFPEVEERAADDCCSVFPVRWTVHIKKPMPILGEGW